jgi:hypothetical protein
MGHVNLTTSAMETQFVLAKALVVPPAEMTPVSLRPEGPASNRVAWDDEAVTFRVVGWYEILMRVDWDPKNRGGTRFCHTMIPDHEPLHSEAIDAEVLFALNGGSQRLRGNTIFGLDHTTKLVLEVWQNSGAPIELRAAEIVVRELCVPWLGKDDRP